MKNGDNVSNKDFNLKMAISLYKIGNMAENNACDINFVATRGNGHH